MDSPRAYSSKQTPHGDGIQFLLGLILAGAASTLLTTIFGIFHVDVFLQVYKLPLSTYATGNFIYSFINTANDVAGAWLVDVFASESSRSSIIGISGCLFAFCFLSLFFLWNTLAGFSPGFHFVTSMSLYDTMYSFMAILMGSVITDNHKMSNDDRIRFMAAAKVVNLVASLIVAKLGLTIFSKQDLQPFQHFVIVIAILACVLFTIAQWMMKPGVVIYFQKCRYRHISVVSSTTDDVIMLLANRPSESCDSNKSSWIFGLMIISVRGLEWKCCSNVNTISFRPF